MTRKQAVFRAIQELKKNKKNSEVVSILQEIYDELPLVRWSKKSILDSIQQFIIDNNNRFPSKRYLGWELPTYKTILRIFQVNNLEEFKEKYFPDTCNFDSPYSYYSNEDFLSVFIDNYNSINGGIYVKYDDYNLYRKPGSPAIETIMRNLQCPSYNELLIMANIKKRKQSYRMLSNRDISVKLSTKNIEELKKIVE